MLLITLNSGKLNVHIQLHILFICRPFLICSMSFYMQLRSEYSRVRSLYTWVRCVYLQVLSVYPCDRFLYSWEHSLYPLVHCLYVPAGAICTTVGALCIGTNVMSSFAVFPIFTGTAEKSLVRTLFATAQQLHSRIIFNKKKLPLDKLINQQEGILAYKVINGTYLLNDFLNHGDVRHQTNLEILVT